MQLDWRVPRAERVRVCGTTSGVSGFEQPLASTGRNNWQPNSHANIGSSQRCGAPSPVCNGIDCGYTDSRRLTSGTCSARFVNDGVG